MRISFLSSSYRVEHLFGLGVVVVGEHVEQVVDHARHVVAAILNELLNAVKTQTQIGPYTFVIFEGHRCIVQPLGVLESRFVHVRGQKQV